MEKKALLLGLAGFFIFSISGCATTSRNNELLNQGLRNKIMALESELNEKDNEINSLKESLAAVNQQPEEISDKTGSNSKPTLRQVQAALKNAGYYQAGIDGRMGRNTRKAIKSFQSANNLPADGKVGKKTWAVLKGYLEKKVK